jgi:hypothetical protein
LEARNIAQTAGTLRMFILRNAPIPVLGITVNAKDSASRIESNSLLPDFRSAGL